MTATNYSRNKILDYNFGGVSYSLPTVWYMGLSSTTPSVTGSSITEPSLVAGYARVAVNNDKSGFSYASAGNIVNSNTITYPVSSGSWGIITNVVLFDSLSSGSAWYFTALSSPRVIADATTLYFSASAVSISMT